MVKDWKTGVLFEAANPVDLASKIKWMLDNESDCIEMGKNARKVFEEEYTAEKNYEMLVKIYHSVLSNR
ncbi:MAG: glycosyltransferase [Candidatus Hodarchaeota archaeon]